MQPGAKITVSDCHKDYHKRNYMIRELGIARDLELYILFNDADLYSLSFFSFRFLYLELLIDRVLSYF
jgi:hypothetical protein